MTKIKVNNHSEELEKALGLDPGSCKHIGNFVFEGTKDGMNIRIHTRPEDDGEQIEFEA